MSTEMLLLCGPTFPLLNFHRPPVLAADPYPEARFSIRNRSIFTTWDTDPKTPSAQEPTTHETKTAYSVWDCSLILSKFLAHQLTYPSQPVYPLHNKRVIELGAGRGIVGISASILGAKVTLTDVEEVVDGLKSVVEEGNGITFGEEVQVEGGGGGTIEGVVGLDWTKPLPSTLPTPDYILGADVIWVPHLIRPLFYTIASLSDPHTITLMAYQSRSTRADIAVEEAIKEEGLVKATVEADKFDPVFWKDGVEIWEIKLK
ncbi:hypothetical protein HK104_004324 [Borealophlyctis nickersoniae]|nr:hypothetical protein HK104_004324 [Borealophlyctis nickersoniae]